MQPGFLKILQIVGVFTISLLVLSCQQDGLDRDIKTEFRSGDQKDFEKLPCIEFIYPVTIGFPDGSTLDVHDQVEWYEIMGDWKKNHPDSDAKPEVQYPVEIRYKGRETITVADNEQMARLKKGCGDDTPKDGQLGKKPCFKLIYPVTIVFPDGNSVEVANREGWHDAIREWKENHPDSDAKPVLQYPVEIIYRNGETKSVASNEEMTRYKKACRDDRPDGDRDKLPCFKLNYPVTIEFPDGSLLEVADGFDRQEAIREWKENHPDSDARPALQFPVEIIYKNGETKSVASKEELARYKKDCRDGQPGDHD